MIFGQGMGNFDNFHEVPVKLVGKPGHELVGTRSFQKEKPLGQLLRLC